MPWAVVVVGSEVESLAIASAVEPVVSDTRVVSPWCWSLEEAIEALMDCLSFQVCFR